MYKHEQTIVHKPDGAIDHIIWLLNGQIHRTNGPAHIKYRDERITESWYIDGKLHRTDGPARITYYDDHKTIDYESWWFENKCHRLDGPAKTMYDKNGVIQWTGWYLDGKKVNDDGDPKLFDERWNELVTEWKIGRMVGLSED